MDDVAPPNGGAVNLSYRQTARRDVCAGNVQAGVEGADMDVRDWNPESSTPQSGGVVNTTPLFLCPVHYGYVFLCYNI